MAVLLAVRTIGREFLEQVPILLDAHWNGAVDIRVERPTGYLSAVEQLDLALRGVVADTAIGLAGGAILPEVTFAIGAAIPTVLGAGGAVLPVVALAIAATVAAILGAGAAVLTIIALTVATTFAAILGA